MSRIYETAIRIGATISAAFGKDTRNAADSLKKLSDATKQLKSAEKAAASFKKLDGEVSRSKARYDIASESLRRLEAAEKAAGGATQESTRWRKAGQREVAKAAREFDRATKAAQKNGEALRAMGVDTSRLTSEQTRLAKALAATERQEKSLERYSHARERLFGKKREHEPLVAKAGEQFKSVGETVLHLAEGALVAGEAMHILVDKTMHAGAEVGETAEKLGIGAKALQELRYGARQSGAEVEDLDRALGKMAINIGKHKAMKGKGGAGLMAIPGMEMLNSKGGEGAAGAIDPFKQIGLNAKDLAKLKPEEQLKKIADGMLKLKTHADRAAVAQEIFGKGATSILPYLAEGSEGIEKLAKSANKYGGVLSDESVAAAIEAEKASKDMNLALGGLANTLGSVLLPTAVKAFKGISSWVGQNREQVKKWAENAAKWIEAKGLPAFKHAVAEVQSFGGKVLWLVNGAAKLTGGFGNLAIVLAGLRLAPLAPTLGKIASQGFQAATALFKYAAASKAAKAAGGGLSGPAEAGTQMGLAAKASMIIGAAAVGYAIGTAIDEYLGASDKIAKVLGKVTGQDEKLKGIEDTDVKTHDLMLQRKRLERDALVRKFEAQGLTHGQALSAADTGVAPAVLRTGGGASGRVHIAPVVHIHGKATRDDVAKGMDKAKQQALDDFDKREAHRRRVSFGK